MDLGTLLVIIGVILAALSVFFASRVSWLLNAAVVLIGLGVLLGVDKVLTT